MPSQGEVRRNLKYSTFQLSNQFGCKKSRAPIYRIAGIVIKPQNYPLYEYKEGILRYQGRIVIGEDKELKNKIMATLHDSTYQNIKALFFWKGLKQEVTSFVSSCEVCQKSKHGGVPYPGLTTFGDTLSLLSNILHSNIDIQRPSLIGNASAMITCETQGMCRQNAPRNSPLSSRKRPPTEPLFSSLLNATSQLSFCLPTLGLANVLPPAVCRLLFSPDVHH
ncbi:hypothetical protein LIER_21002 [Lithospermum erythrorhizon]|uniref:Integrase zinc-binding domain-containing protein n=1 Tax=Lithospermum erythrorhizon TaxID=34254 RepID=A0AAV3QRG5_LITER